jgi:hypothetical protein
VFAAEILHGLSTEPAMGGKWLGLLKEAVPNLSRAAISAPNLGSGSVWGFMEKCQSDGGCRMRWRV